MEDFIFLYFHSCIDWYEFYETLIIITMFVFRNHRILGIKTIIKIHKYPNAFSSEQDYKGRYFEIL